MDQHLGVAIRNLPSDKRARLREILMAKGVELSTLPIAQRPSDLGVIPASFAQQRLWFLHQLDPHSSVYNVPAVVQMDGALKVGALSQALNQVMRRHDSLRTTFSSVDGKPVQVVASSTEFDLPQTDLSMHDASERSRQSKLLAHQEAELTFDLARGPLLRARLLRLASDEHILLLTAHHIIADGASMEVLASELMASYEAYATGRAPSLPDLPVQYADYAYWQRHWLGDEALQAHIAYWTQQLEGAPEVLALPTDRPRLGTRTRSGATVVLKLGGPLTQQLHALALQTHTMLFMVFSAAFNVLLWRHSGQDDICVGTVMSGRSRTELEPLIGLFANTLVMRTRLRATDSFSELLQQVKATTLDAHAHQDAPFEQLLQVLQPTRDARYSPLFQVMLVLQDAPKAKTQAASLGLDWARHGNTQSKFDLTLNVLQDGGQITARFEYDASLFDASTIERMAGHFELLLQDATARPHTTLNRLQLLGEPERRQVLHGFNDTAASFPEDLCIHPLFEQQAARTPEATALVFEDASLTYRELNTQANRLAHHLIDLGVRPDSRVAIALPRGIDLVVALLATLKAGGAYVPLDPEYPVERLAYMLADSAPCVCITDTATSTALGGMRDALTVLQLDADRSWQSLPSTNPNPDALGLTATHLAYVIYTSGSTGQPKGAMNAHRGVVNRLLWMQQTYRLNANDSVLQKTTFGFDVSVWEFFWPLLAGARLVLARPQGQRDAAYLAELIEREHITTLHFVPSMLTAFLADLPPGSCSSLQRVICSGEALEPHQVSFVHERLAHTRLYNLYGPTEAAIDVTAGEPQPGQTVTIGSPIANTRIYMLTANGEPAPVGVAGEIHIGGIQVARGYLHRPDLTAERFVPDPFGEPGSRMYRTGDLGRWRPDGSIEYLGRNDHQVKIRGFRIELGEIETALRSHADVQEAVVLAREDMPGDRRLVAYVVGHAAPETLRTHLGSRLPEYMVPAAYVALDALPLTPNGKLDRRALPAPEADAFGACAYEAPQGEIETLLAHLWSELLGIARIGRHDDFFALGGHSLLAVQLTSRIRAALGLEVPLAELFARPTLAGFALRVAAATTSALPAIVPASRSQALPLSFAQQRLWFLAQLDSRANAAYAIPGGVRLKGSLDVAALQAALNRIVERHEALRTCFGSVEGVPVQLIATPEVGFALAQVDLSHGLAPEGELERMALEEARAPFDLARGPLVRGCLLRLADNDHALLVTMHHIVSDAWSVGVLVNEFSALYAAYAQGQPDPLPAMPIQYADYAVWQRRWITGEVLQRQLDFWRDHLGGAPAVLELPTDRPRPAVQDYAGASLGFKLDAELSANLKALSQRHGTTLFMTLLGAWAALLARLSGQHDVVIGIPVANRHHAEIEPLIGLFVNMQALRIDLSGSPSVAELLAQVRASALAMQEHQDIPFEQVVEALSPTRSMAHSPIFQVTFAWQNAPKGRLELPGLQMEPSGVGASTIKFDLELSLHDAGDCIAGHIDYACALFDRTTIERHVAHWQVLLRGLVANDRTIVSRLPLLSEEEQHQLLHGFNDTAAGFPEERCIHELFETQVQRTPEATALVFEDISLTYAELNAQANRLAHHLIMLGVQPDTRVATAMPRGIDLVVAFLATLKAGGAYVPLDPDYPAERLATMLDDCRPRVVLTHAAVQERLPASRALLTAMVLELDDPGSWAHQPTHNPEPVALGLRPSHLAYVMYTSGSTGTPKGVMVAHQAVVKLVMNNGYARFDASDRVAFAANPAFDASTMEVWAPLLHGGVVVVIAQDVLLDAPRYDEALRRHGVTAVFMSVGLFHQYAPLLSGAIRQLRYLMVGGDLHDPQVFAQVLRDSPPRHLLHVYGPTETTTFAASYDVREVPSATVSLPLGGPISNTRIYILDTQGLPVPVGGRGEIHIGGLGVARGYLKRPDLTAERFIPDPFAALQGARMYKTGDLGRWLPDGTIEFLGRNDHQVKIRGFRIELGEIEVRLREYPGVQDAVLLAREDSPGHKRLVAYVTGPVPLAPEVLRAHLSTRLPEYMIPAAYVQVECLPLTRNGKLDRRALPAPSDSAFGQHAYEAPEGGLESALAAIWSELLGIERIGRHDNFFALGGHSLLAVQLTSRIRTTLGLDVALAELFAQPTLAGFAQCVAAATASSLPAIVPASRLEALPLSFAQQRLWFLAQLDERAGAAYAIPEGVRLKGLLDAAALHAALNRVVARHEALRTCFGAVDGAPVQLIAPPDVGLALSQVDLSGHADPEAELERLAAEEAGTPFDLACGPLIRARLVRMAGDDHALLVTMHHIVSDGWSMGVLVNEFSALYAAYAQGQPDPLPALPIQYADYAVWQRRWITGEVLQRQLDFWRHHLGGAPALLELPTDRPRPPVQDHVGEFFALELDLELSASLKALSQRHGTTLFMTLLAAWAALLARLSGQSDVVIGTPVANRHRAEIEPLIGFFVNMQALRVDLSGAPSVAELLAQVRATALAAQEHQDIPFEQVVEAISPIRSLGHSPVFQVMFTWQNAPAGSLDLPGLQLEPVGASSTMVKFDLELTVHDAGECIVGGLSYACALFDRSTIERHLGHWQTLLRALVADEGACVARLPLLTLGEQHLLNLFNDTATSFPREQCIHQLFEQQAERTPAAAALVFEDTCLSYAELNAQANRLAHHLIALGVRPGSLVAIELPRGIELLVALLATMKAGGAYVPLDPDYPRERLAYMLADSSPRVLITDTVTRHALADLPASMTVLPLDADLSWQSLPATNPDPAASGLVPFHLAYVIYTSGSTGQPKGVMVAHHEVVNFLQSMAREPGLQAHDTVLATTSLSFDIAGLELYLPLSLGARIVLVRREVTQDGTALARLVDTSGATVMQATPATWRMLLEAQWQPHRELKLLCGGEALSRQLADTLLAHGGELWNLYGPTETTIWSTAQRMVAGQRGVTVGRPIANTRVHILDAAGAPVPVGVLGQLYIGGRGVARGYLHRPDLTAERFVPDPYGEPGSRMYQTGDLGRWRADGTIEFLGRNDHQVKVRGFRIELGEIESALRSHSEVREAVVLAREDVPGDQRLVAYIVGEAAPEALRAHLGSRLPEYMVPAAYVPLDALPLTPNGKLDRRALPAPADTAFGQLAYEAPEGELESTLASIWSELLGVQRIGRGDNFFALGGHSLLAVQLASRIRARLGSEVPLAELFAQPTLAGFALRVASAHASALPAIVPAAREAALPLSFAQQRLWFLAQLDARAAAAYAIPGGVRLKGALDVAALRAALDRIVARHEALRTSFVLVEGEPVQAIAAPEVGLALTQVDLSGHAGPEAELQRLATEDATAPFDLERGPLIRGRLLRLGDDDHVLLVTMHHIVSDGWSMGVLINEFSALYAAFAQGRPDPLPPLDVQYPDYAVWQRHWLAGAVLRRQLDFWRHHLEGAPALLELPTDRPRPPVQDYAGASFAFAFDAELSANLKAFSQRHGSTLFMTLLAAWAALLSRLSGQDEVVIGTPVANRHRAEVEPLIGFFVNTQALRIDLSASPSVAQLLAQVRATALAAQAHQDIPFEQVVEALSPVRSMAHSPVFQVMFAWQNAPEGTLELPGLQLQPVSVDASTIKFDLELSLQEAGDCIAGSLGYASALFDRASIERHIAHWQTLLRALVADDQAIVARLPLLSADERLQLLHGFNDTAASFPAEHCIHELFEDQVACTPEAIALVFEDDSLSYAELNARANRLAHHLIALGVQPDTRVAIALPRGIEMVVALLATLKAGAGYVPLDPDYPIERLTFMLADSAPRVLVTQSGVRAALGELPPSLAVLALDAPARPWEALPAANPDPRVLGLTPTHLAYVIYTSGSTGTPKGVMVEHAQVVRLLRATQAWFGFGCDDVWTLFHSYAFDFSVWELWGALAHGGRLMVVPQLVARSPGEFYALLCEQGVTVLNQTPSAFRQLIAAQADSDRPHRLRCVVFGGEALEPATLAPWYARNGERTQLVNMYGITETTVHVTYRPLSPEDVQRSASPIGVPIPDLRVVLLDAQGQLVPMGVIGEIYVGGAGLTRGYLNRPELTAERFLPDPFAAEPGARMYRTGDLGRWRPDGTIEFLGRNDHQVKLRGFRIELGEIEARLQEHPGVREAVVLAREDQPGQPRLVAYVVGKAVPPETLRAHLAAALPEYMVPAAYVPLDTLPLTPNGKLDRRALPAPADTAFGQHAYEAPEGEFESTLAAIWSELLGVQRIGRHDDFFTLGGHSLLAVQLASRIRARLGYEVPLAELFAQPTLAGFAQRVASAHASALPAIVPAAREGALPLSFAQQRLWFLAQLDARAAAAYAMPGGVRLHGALDAAALQAALDRIVARHEALRTSFASVEGEPVQVIAAPEVGFALTQVDLSGHAAPEAELEHLATEEAGAPFDLERGPLIRASLLRLAHDDHVLLVTMHHIVSDGWSMGVLINEFSALYAAFSQSRPDPLPPLPIQYADYAVWQRRWITGEVLQRQLDFWRNHLSGAPALLELPTDRPRPAVQDYAGASFAFAFDAELSANLKALSQRQHSTLFMTLLASWAALLSRLSGQDEVVIGTPVANRHRAEVEPLIGFFVNTQALRIDLSASPSVAQLLAQVRATALAVQDHQDLPFEQVVEALQPQRSLAHSPVFQVMFAWQNAPEGTLQLPGLQLQPVGADASTIKFDLELSLQEAGDCIAGSLGYASALFDRASVERHIAHWQTLLRALVADEQAIVARLPLLSANERLQLLHGFNDTAAPLPAERCIHELFEDQVARTPKAIALVFEDTEISYAELNAQANPLAHHLIARGVRRGDFVALALPRSADLVIAQLAVLKCGAAYVPLDLEHPAERLRFILDDCRAAAMVCRGESPAGRPDLPCLDLQRLATDGPDCRPARAAHAEDAAYAMYTSGSTGVPKGVVVPHRAVVNFALNRAHARLDPSDRMAFVANPAFDASTFEVWTPLLCGAALVVIDQPTLLQPQALAQRLLASRVTVLHLTAGLLPAYGPALASLLPRLRYLLTGGDRVDAGAVAHLLARCAPQHLLHCYGPTETTTFAVTHEVSALDPRASSLPLGRPIANARIYLLDALGQPVPVGVAGEIHIGGAGIAHGYLNRPELTAERFVPDPFAAKAGARMYRTGDLGRWRIDPHGDGTIEFLGRNDHQVKLRGFRIELGEIEARLREHPDVREAVVLAREDAPGHKRLVAYVVGEPTQPEVLPETLRAHLAAALPEYMVPAAYVGLDALPLTPNGKLDRRALPAPADTAFGQLAYEAPEGELETTLASIWSELLGVQRIGRRDDFFELGGHSLLAVQLASRIRARLGSEVPLADLFAQPTLAGFATRVAAASSSALPAIVPAARQGALPLSFAQQRLWFLAQLDARAAAAYAMPGGVRLRGALDIAALQAALNRIVARHEALRTSFVLGKGEPVQVIAAPEVGLALTQVDLSGHAAPEAELERLAAEEAAAPFDLERGPLIRARLVRLAHDDHVLLVTMHHIVSDGWSMGVLINEFSALYAAFSQGRPDPLPPLDVQYPDYAMWQRRWITGTVLQRQLDFWRAHLEGAPALLELPTDRPRPPVQDYAGASVAFAFDNELSANLKALSQRHGSTLFMTLLASWAALLSRLSEQDEVVIGTPVANRHRAEVEPLIGFFVNTQALRIDLSASPSVGQLLAQVRATALAAQDHQDLPFEQVVEALQPQRSLAHSPVFQVMFSWQNAPEGTLQLPGLQLQPVAADASTIKFDLELSLQEAGNCIAGSLSYASALFDRASVARHIAHWQTLLRALVADDQAIVARLPLLSADERFQLLHGFNNTAAAFPQARCIHQLFEEQAACTPEATALVFEDATLTYRELNAQANRLAHHLIALGVRPDSLVAIALPRGIDMVVALLATLKAGGAYVPLDPAYPAERLGYMLDDCQARWVVTDTAAQTRLSGSPVLSTATVLALDASHQPWNACAGTNPDRAILGLMPSHLAYVIYTSGSTGRPKGAMVEHAGLCNLALARIDGFQVTPSSRVLQFASFSFDACIFEVLMALCSGAALHVPAPGVLAGAALHHVLREGCITHTLLPPTVLAGLPDDSLPQLQTLFTGGEAASHALVQRWATGRRLINAYGPTEATVCATMHVCDTRHPGSPPIGSPIANTRVYILDVHGQPSPVGVAGEIHIAGIQVARGYLRRPDLTAERFVPDPFGEPGSRMYKTGDLGRWQLDGTIEFMGRNDHQVKVRGFRIELGEIEARLLAHPAVREAVVLAREDEPGHTRLVAYVVGQPGQPEVLPEVLRAHVASALPEYMVPAVYVPLDALPLTPNGKLDRLALPAPNELHFLRHQYEAPRMGIEQALAEVWSQVLGVSRIGREDHFFELGGHSLLAVRLLSLSAQRGLHMTLQDVYAYPTLRAQAARLSGTEDSSQPQALAARRDGAATPLFAVPTGTGHTAYAFDLGARLDADVPVYALPWPQTMPASMDALAAYMVSLMRAKQAHGPYRLLGYSSGGLVAYAMAQLLAELDEPVEFVGLLDCRNPEIPSVQETQEERARHLLVGELRERVQQDAYSGQHDLHQAVRLLEEKAPITDWAELVAWAEALPALQSLAQQENTTIAEFAATCLRIAAYEKLWPTYLPRPLPAPLKLHLFYATEEAQLPPPLGWDRLLSSEQVEVVPVGGTHMSMMKPPHLTALGRAISQALSATHRVRTRDTDEF